jgi:Tfp pilus assembly protein PilP
MRPAMTIIVGFLLATIAPGLSAQTKPAATPQQKPTATAQQKPAAPAPKPTSAAPAQQKTSTQTAKPVATPAKPGAQAAAPKTPAAKPAAPKTAATKPAKKPATPVRAAADKKPSAGAEAAKPAVRRDPFESLVARQEAAAKGGQNLPPGKAGLQVGTLRVDGIVKANSGMIAVVTNPQARTYFLREGDRLYDGAVEKISMDGVTFHEEGKDAFGKPVERQVNKRIYSMAGEQQ